MCSRERITCEQSGEQQWTGFWTGLFDLLEASSYCRRAFFLPWSPACFISVTPWQGGCPFCFIILGVMTAVFTHISIHLSFRLMYVLLLQICYMPQEKNPPIFLVSWSLLEVWQMHVDKSARAFSLVVYLRPFRFAIAIFQGWVQNICSFFKVIGLIIQLLFKNECFVSR